MNRATMTIVLGGIAIAAGAAGWLLHRGQEGPSRSGIAIAIARANANPAPRAMTREQASAQRSLHYRNVDTVAETLSLPSSFARREALHVLAGRADVAKLRALIGEARRLRDPAYRLDALEILMLRYVETDPGAALKSALETDRTASVRLVEVVIGAWSRSELDNAIHAARGLPTEALRTAAAQAIVGSNPALAARVKSNRTERRQLAARLGVRETSDAFAGETDPGQFLDDPHQAVETALGWPPGEARRQRIMKIAQAWARVAPEEAWEYSVNLSDDETRIVFENALIATWAQAQPEGAFAHVTGLRPDSRRDQLLRQVTVELARRDPGLAMQVVTQVKVADRAALQSLVVDEWARYDPATAAKWVEGQARAQQGRFAFQVADSYVLQKPEEALAWALRISRSPGRNLWSHMVGRLAAQDPDYALRIALSVDNAAQRNQALGNALAAIAVRDPGLALRHLEKLPAGSLRSRAMMQIASQIAESSSPAAALDWIDSLGQEGRGRSEALQGVARSIAYRDPDAAALLLDRIPKGPDRGLWIASVASGYGMLDPDKGLQWIRKFQDDPDAEGVAASFVAQLANSNPEAAMEFVERVEGKQRDQMIVNIIPQVAMQSPETAVRYHARIADESLREQSTHMIVSQWARQDPAAAQKWVMSMPTGPARDRAMLPLLHGDLGLEETLSVVNQMQSPAARMDAVVMAYLRLQRTSPQDAQTLLRRHPLDPQRQQQLETMQQRRSVSGRYPRGE